MKSFSVSAALPVQCRSGADWLSGHVLSINPAGGSPSSTECISRCGPFFVYWPRPLLVPYCRLSCKWFVASRLTTATPSLLPTVAASNSHIRHIFRSLRKVLDNFFGHKSTPCGTLVSSCCHSSFPSQKRDGQLNSMSAEDDSRATSCVLRKVVPLSRKVVPLSVWKMYSSSSLSAPRSRSLRFLPSSSNGRKSSWLWDCWVDATVRPMGGSVPLVLQPWRSLTIICHLCNLGWVGSCDCLQ